ncbi:hypothetical protein F4678DRAFT_481885 [Xylaria arbuscula]|nr:hypothetical protein F4678DRAFT_481885 [Xylaria arbuscula]
MGFRNLQSLILYLGLGRKDNPWDLEDLNPKDNYPVFREKSAEVGARHLFQRRQSSSSSKLSNLVIKTGEPLRRFPQWEPLYNGFERRHEDTVKVLRPSTPRDVPKVVMLPRDILSLFLTCLSMVYKC